MFINEFENSNEYKLQQIVHTLKSIYGVELKLDESTEDDLASMRHSSEIIKNSIISENQFNTYNNNPEYTKHTLIMEAVRLYLTEIAPKRQKRNKIKENAVPSTPSTPSVPSNGSANTAPPPGANAAISSSGVSGTTTSSANTTQPGMVSVQKGTDKKTVPAAQLAALQAQGYTVVGDENAPVHEDGSDDTAPDGHPADLESLMHEYGIEEGAKEKIGGMIRRQKQKSHPLQNRRDVAHNKAGEAYAAGDAKKGKRYLDWRRTSLDKDGVIDTAPFESAGSSNVTSELSNLMQKYGVEGEVDEGMKEKIGGFLRRMSDKDRLGQSRSDVVAKKANMAYAGGDTKKGNRYMSLISKGAPKVKKSIKTPNMSPNFSVANNPPVKKGLQPTQLPTRAFGRRGMAMSESIGTSTFDAQASMARAELYRNTKYAMEMLRLIRPEDDIPAWIASNLVKAGEYLDQIFHYMDYYTKFEPENLPEGMDSGEDLDIDSMPPEEMGKTTGSIARENLTMIIEYSTKLFNMIQPGDKLEGWVAMKLTSASNAISNSKHYLDYVQFEKHAGDHISDMASAEPIDEKAPTMKKRIKENLSVGQMLMRMMVNEDQDLAQAQALIAAKSLSDDLMTMAEKVSKMSVDDLMPLVDTLKDQFGPEAAQGYDDVVKKSLDLLLRAVTDAKKISDDAITQLQGGSIPGASSMGDQGDQGSMPPAPSGDQGNAAPEGSPPMPAVPNEPLGRSKKDDGLSEAWGKKMKTPEKKKGMWDGYTLAELKAKKKKLMDKEERTDKEQTVVKELTFAIRAKQKNKWGTVKESSNTGNSDLDGLMQKYGVKGNNIDEESNVDDLGQTSVVDQESTPVDLGLENLMKKYGVTGDKSKTVAESKKLTERNKENAVKKKAVIDPKKRPEKKNDFDIRNMKPPFKKKPSDTIKIKEAAKKAKPNFLDVDKDGDKKEPFKKAVADKAKGKKKVEEKRNPADNFTAKHDKETDLYCVIGDKSKHAYSSHASMAAAKEAAKKRNDAKKKVDESAPTGKDAESFIRENKENFAKRYGKKGDEVLYATAWKKFGKKSESVIATGKLLENHNAMLTKLEQAFNAHKVEYARNLKEGKHDDPLGLGYGLDGELLIKQMNDVKSTISQLKESLKREITKGAKAMKLAEQNTHKVSTISAAKRVAPWGVAWKSTTGRNQAKFFESQSDRDYWLKLKNLTEAKLINPEHFDREISKISSKKV